MRHRDRIARTIDDRNVRGVFGVCPGCDALNMEHCAFADLARNALKALRIQQPLHRNIEKGRIAHMLVLVAGRAFHRLGDYANVFRTVVTERDQVEVFQDGEHF